MQNQMNSQYIQPQYAQNPYCTPCYQPQGYYGAGPSVGAVNIQIYNPTANPQPGFYQPVACNPYPCNYNNMIYQNPYPAPSDYNNGQINPNMNQSLNVNNNQNGVAAQGEGDEGKKTEEKKDDKDKKPKVALTDDYIKTLENYLNSQDKKIRLMGAKELFERFREDETRKNDAALTALLNKTLQDPAETVKFLALTALDTGYATGNDETAQILTQMQSSDSSYGEDAALASRILLKMSGYKANADAAALQNAQGAQNAAQSDTALNQNQAVMPEPSLNTAQNMAAVDKMPPAQDGVLKTPSANASMTQNMQIAPNGQTNMSQTMVPPLNNSQAVA